MFLVAQASAPPSGQIVPNVGVQIDFMTIIILIAVVVFAVALAQLFLLGIRALFFRRRRRARSRPAEPDLDE